MSGYSNLEKDVLINLIDENRSEEEIKSSMEFDSKGKKGESKDMEEKDVEEWEDFRKAIAIVTILLIAIVVLAFYIST